MDRVKVKSYARMLNEVYKHSQDKYTDNYRKFHNRMHDGFNEMWLVQMSNKQKAKEWLAHFLGEIEARRDTNFFNLKEYWAIKDEWIKLKNQVDRINK